jgi:predicted TIM-barrel fold metal-dependent hydrolase
VAEGTSAADVARLKPTLSHPIVDADGHLVESPRLLARYYDKVAGRDLAARIRAHQVRLHSRGDAATGDARSSWWGGTNVADDLAALMLPELLAERLGTIGIDYAVLYPTLGLGLPTIPDDECRRAACRALNIMNAELAAGCERVLTVAACIPMHTPEEAVAELAYCVRSLGMKVAMIPAGVARPWPDQRDSFPTAGFTDCYGVDSHHDYDPVWQEFCDQRVAVTAHGAPGLRFLDGGFRSPSNYMFNHIGGHAFQQMRLCKSLVMGGVLSRFPQLPFMFLEGGVAWAVDLLSSLGEHWEKRNQHGLERYDPSQLDSAKLNDLLAARGHAGIGPPRTVTDAARPSHVRDEFEDSGVLAELDFASMFDRQMFFGCEADDRSVRWAFDGGSDPDFVAFNAVFSSDIGHWDVPDMDRVVLASRILVDGGLIGAAAYRQFTFENVVRLHTALRPDFFDATSVADDVAALDRNVR